MPVKKQEIPRPAMSKRERDLRSRLAKLIHGAGLVRGTLNAREKVCGKANCKCTRGEKHGALYLVASYGGKLRQLFVPKTSESTTRQWVASYQEAKELLEEISRWLHFTHAEMSTRQ